MSPNPDPPPGRAGAPTAAATGPRRRWRRLALLGLVVAFLGLSQPAAYADPHDAASVPANLRQYVPGTPEWTSSPWMTSPSCRDHGGDWSIYTQDVVKDTPALLQFFQPDFGGGDQGRSEEILAGYRDIAAQITVPEGYCVDQARQWAGPSGYKPFGFDWGNATADSHHHSNYECANNTGADNAPCGGFYLACSGAATAPQHQQCEAWNAFSDGYVTRVNAARSKANADHPGATHSDPNTEIKSPGEIMQDILDWATKHGMAQVVSFIVDGVTKLWAVFIKLAVGVTSPDLSGAGFTSVYNLVAGVALALAFLGWLATLATSWKQGRMQFSLFGGIKAVAGITLAGVGAILMLQLADQCTQSLAAAGGDLAHQADFTTSLAKSNPIVALIAGGIIALSIIFAIIFLVIHGPLVLMWALFGSVAAAGQVHPASSGWLAKWAGRLVAIAWVKFAMVAVFLLCQALMLPLNAGEDVVKQIVDVIQGLTLALLLVTTPWLLWELVEFVADRPGAAGSSAGRSGDLAAAGTSATTAAMGSAVSTMMSAVADLGRQFAGGTTSGQASGSSTGPGGASGGGAGGHDQQQSSPDPGSSGSSDGGAVRAAGGGGSGGAGGTDASTSSSAPGDGDAGAGEEAGDGGRQTGSGGSTRPPSGPSGDPASGTTTSDELPPANLGRVVARAPRTSKSPSASGGASGSTSGGRAAAGAAPPPIPPA
ncbi:hypothetical protein F0L68_40980 [Solihabitans fulvus]|uniref:TrbL/VirB6 plasmid conjugal transfer protein n=1 Tax=Solihabitans fulvus TaxID=1892852 RepID=A0A5B2W6V3_9PSEU|nr:hypothetical protein [Solihabitans fulvus]KAA2245939.1 hypothetical protein F0L68_40980 [Solihabitans fulvus]